MRRRPAVRRDVIVARHRWSMQEAAMNPSRATVLAILTLHCAAATAGPCTSQIAELEQQIHSSAPGPQSGPMATQAVGAQLHHQPTPGDIEGAEASATAAADAALDRARKADSQSDASACADALREARRLYGME